ncbi:MAG: metallophosphoesterase [Spirochaetia bacterium]|jgi:Icc-related predicted phosphoesterase
MKVLCIADHVDPVIYSSNLKSRFSEVDLVLSAGDLALEYYDFILSSLNKPLFFVFGNHHLEGRAGYRNDPFDNRTPWERGVGATSLEGKVVRVKGLILAGLGGSIWYNGGDNQYTDFSMFFSILKLIPGMLWNKVFHGRFLDILLTHSPPYGINDLPDACHTGFRIFLWFIRHFHPAYLIHGHVHLYDRNAAREAKYAGTTVLNAYDHTLLTVEISR